MIAQLDKESVNLRPALVPRRLVSYAFFEGRPVTTRGRWLNPVLLRFYRTFKHLPGPRVVKAPIYIIGTGRSGTTILGKLFHMHPACGFLNEPKLLWHVIYPYEDVVGTYSRQTAYYPLDAGMVSEDARNTAHRLYGFYLWVTRASRVVDKYPEMLYRIPFIQAIFPDARFIFLVRNGLDTLQSIAAWSDGHGQQKSGNVHNWWGVNYRKWTLLLEQVVPGQALLAPYMREISGFTRQEDMAAVEWIAAMQTGLSLLKAQAQAIRLVRYEDLVRKPVETLARLLEFCELPQDDIMLEYAQRVLSPPASKHPVSIHPAIRPAFEATMQALDYSKAR